MRQDIVNPPSDLAGVWSGLSGTVNVSGLPSVLSGALNNALNVSGAPRATSAVTGQGTDAGAASANPGDSGAASAPGSPSAATGASGWTRALPSWLQYALFHDWFTGKDGRTEDASIKSLLVLIVFVVLGASFLFVGVKTLAE